MNEAEREKAERRSKWLEAMGYKDMGVKIVDDMLKIKYDEVVSCLRELGKVWTGTMEQKRMYGALKERERELIASGEAMESEVYGMRAYLRKRQMEDAQRRPDRSVAVWGLGGRAGGRGNRWRA